MLLTNELNCYSTSTNILRAEANSGSNITKTNAHSGILVKWTCAQWHIKHSAVMQLQCVFSHTWSHIASDNTIHTMRIWADIFLSAGYQWALIQSRLRAAAEWGGLRNPFERIWIYGSPGSIIFCSAASSHHGVGDSAERKELYQEADKERANTPAPTDPPTWDATLGRDYR